MISPGDSVTLRGRPSRYLAIADPGSTVVSVNSFVTGGRQMAFATVLLADGRRITDVPCDYLVPITGKPKRRSPLKLKADADTRTEAQRQSEGAAWLRRIGYTVLEIGKGRKGVKCPKCGTFTVATGWQGTDPGCPDTIVSRDCYPPATWFGVEWKNGPNGKRRPEQAALEQEHRIVVVWDLPSLARAVAAFEGSIGITPLREVAAIVGNGKSVE